MAKTAKATNKELLDEIADDDKVKGICLDYYDSIRKDRSQLDWRFYVNEMYYEGEHYARWNRYTSIVETPKPKKGEMRATIPFAKTVVDANVADLLKDKPDWNVLPQPNSQGEIDQPELQKARWSNDLLDYYYDKCQLGLHLEPVCRSAVMNSVGWLYVNFDSEKKSYSGQGRGDIVMEPVPAPDLYLPLTAPSVEDSPILIRTLTKNIQEIRNSKVYADKKSQWEMELKPDEQTTDSDRHQQFLQDTLGASTSSEPGDRGSVLLAECWLKYYPKDSTDAKYRVVTIAVKQALLLRNEETDLERPPFFLYRTRRKAGQIYAQGIMGDLIPINRAIDNLESRKLEYNYKYTKGQYVVDRGANINRLTNESGDIIQKNRGHQFTVVPLPPIPPTVSEQIARLEQSGQDVGGVHDVSLGRAPKGIESARALESLLYGDSQAKRIPRANLESFLQEVGKHVLWLINKYFPNRRLIQFYNREGQLQRFHAIGNSKAFQDYPDTVSVKPDNDVKVTIGSALGETPEARQQKAMEMFKASLFRRSDVVKTMVVGGNVDDIAKGAWEEAKQAEQVRNAPPPTTIRDFLTIKLTDLSPNERGQVLQKHLGIQPDQDLEQIPGSLSNQLSLKEADHAISADQTNHQLAADLTKQDGQVESDLSGQEQASLNPAIPGGAIDPTQGDPGELSVLPGQEAEGEQGAPTGQ